MKFLCDQCKAKYQIADDKVVGKTVRMKCRKCGHMIEVKAEVTESSVATKLPAEPRSPTDRPMLSPRAPTAPTAPRAPMAKAPVSTGGAPLKPAAPRNTLATSLASARSPVQARSEGPLASAFQKSVQKDDDAAMLELSTASEWYVAINGVPVGPIRVGELKRKAAGGGITEDSLCWQEGMEEWRPVRTVTELAALLREVAAAGRPSLVTPPPPDVRPSASPPVVAARPYAPSPRGPLPSRSESNRPLAPAARNNVVAINSRLATAEKFEEDDHTVVGDPFAAMPASKPMLADMAMSPAPVAAASFGAIAAEPRAPLVSVPPPPAKQPPWIAIGMIVLFGAFGVTAAIMLFSRPPVVAAQPAVTAPPTTTVAAAPTNTTIDPVPVASIAAPIASNERPVAVNNGGQNRPAPVATAGKPIDPSIAALLGNDHGPVGPGSGGGGGGGGGGGSALSGDAIEGVVRQHATGVKRTCWERGGSTAADVSVKVHLTIAGNGSVQNATASGNDPAIAKCIENSVRQWTFPASAGSTDVDIPFHFLRQ